MEKCSNCLFWKQDLHDKGNPEANQNARDRGFCTRYPPVLVGTRFQHPVTKFNLWCGEWEEKE